MGSRKTFNHVRDAFDLIERQYLDQIVPVKGSKSDIALRMIKRHLPPRLKPKMASLKTALASPVRAIMFAQSIDDHYDRLQFLRDWTEGDLDAWADFREYVGKEGKG